MSVANNSETPNNSTQTPNQPKSGGGKTGWSVDNWINLISSVITFFALIGSLWFGKKSIDLSKDSLRATEDSLRQNNLATIYAMSGELTKLDHEKTELAKFFDKELLQSWVSEEDFWKQFDTLPKERQTKELRQEYQSLWESFKQLEPDKKVIVYTNSQRIADFSQILFIQREIIPEDDWDAWWSYLTDQYDESPFYRAYLTKRANWYSFEDAIKPEKRKVYFRKRK